ncbi:MAG: ATP-binding protein [Lachnospiraceae bacterium]|nr:ATP-binding protein [Lachnospiraceae bacterium]
MSNPFTISFGRQPAQFISRPVETNEIIENFEQEPPSSQVYMLTGVRGSGKTVLMTDIAKELSKRENWLVVELSTERDMLTSLAAKLCSRPELFALFVEAKLNFSLLGFGVEVKNAAPISDIETALARMLGVIRSAGKKLLVTVDEAVNNPNVRVFASTFQIFMRQEYPVFLLMTGLYDNIHNLQNEKTLTFLYRAPKITLGPLNLTSIRLQYAKIFGISMKEAGRMADLTMGYPFAFQVLGYLYWNSRDAKTLDEVLPEYDRYLEEYVYSKIWSELSETDKQIVAVMAATGKTKVGEIREEVAMKPEKFSVYRERLKRKGVIDTSRYGAVTFALPRFDVFVRMMTE